jgi:hypothetical protein
MNLHKIGTLIEGLHHRCKGICIKLEPYLRDCIVDQFQMMTNWMRGTYRGRGAWMPACVAALATRAAVLPIGATERAGGDRAMEHCLAARLPSAHEGRSVEDSKAIRTGTEVR